MSAQLMSVSGCARCGGDHRDLEMRALSNPPEDATHFAVCPTTTEPILVYQHHGEHAAGGVALLPCPFDCGAEISGYQDEERGVDRMVWHPDNDCILAGRAYNRLAWNRRIVAPPPKTTDCGCTAMCAPDCSNIVPGCRRKSPAPDPVAISVTRGGDVIAADDATDADFLLAVALIAKRGLDRALSVA
jgi:hypothetical protein